MWLAVAVWCCISQTCLLHKQCVFTAAIFCGPISFTWSSKQTQIKPGSSGFILSVYGNKNMQEYAQKPLSALHVSNTSSTYLYADCFHCAVSVKTKSDVWGKKKKMKCWESPTHCSPDTHRHSYLMKTGIGIHPAFAFRMKKHSYPGKYILYDRHTILPSKCWLIIFNMQH